MDPEEFRRRGGEILDFIAGYLSTLETRRVRAEVRPGEIFARMPEHAPERSEGWDAILKDAMGEDGPVLSGLTHWQHPSFFGYFPASTSYPGVLGDLLCSGLGVIGMLWATSPSCTEVEMRVLDWLAEWLGLPGSFTFSGTMGSEGGGGGGGVIQGTASEATLSALVAGRWRVLEAMAGEARRTERVVAYTSEQAHSSVMKAAMVAGLAHDANDRSRVRLIAVDGTGAMRTELLREAMERDVRAGLKPVFVCATLGTTGTGAVDDVEGVARAIDGAMEGVGGARGSARPWLHVDAAYAGCAMVCPEFRWMNAGLERADSFCVNPHKWLLTNFDCDCFWTRDRRSLTGSMAIRPAYLRNGREDGEEGDGFPVVDYRDWHVPLGRRFRSLKLWFVMRHYGLEGLRAHIRGHVRLAGMLEGLVAASERFEPVGERRFGLVCLRPRARAGEKAEGVDERARWIVERVNASGRALLIHTALPEGMAEPGRGRVVIRVSIGSPGVEERHVREVWRLLEEAAGAVS